MKIQLASDLHLEFLQRDWPGERLIKPAADADVLVLAGDIAQGIDALELFKHWPVPVVYVAGNHEFYGHAIESMRDQMRVAAARHQIHLLENESVEIKGVRFMGTTLWTNYRLNRNRTQRQLMEYAQIRLNDHQLIRCGSRRFTTQDALDRHESAHAWLESGLALPFEGKTVVISHHGPHPLSVHPRYAADALNSAFVSDLSPLMPGVDLWLHGHVHDSFDYQIGRCRVVANPAGYVMNRGWENNRDRFEFENPGFRKDLLLEMVP
jgi:predicted phosphodiesterase